MTDFMTRDFLLQTETARHLYHNHAACMPIIDYHCHINPAEIAENRVYENLTQVWLYGDHYKWRAIRTNAVPERLVTGPADDYQRFEAWAAAVPKLIGSPLYHWTHLELQRYFDIFDPLSSKTAPAIWEKTKAVLDSLPVREIMRKSGVELICTTDDPADDLQSHKAIADSGFATKVLPAFRPDKALRVEKPTFTAYIAELSKASGLTINSVDNLKAALAQRLDHFQAHGCRAADHGLETVPYHPASEAELNAIFKQALKSEEISQTETAAWQTELLLFLAKEYHQRGWAMELHYGIRRDNNTIMYNKLGPDTGFDCLSGCTSPEGLINLLNALAQENKLPKTLIFCANPADNTTINTLAGCFQGEEAPAKVQQGTAWWFNDTRHGMENQLTDFAALSALGNFIGFLTDSRSFLSYPRHEYFRRILCNLLGGWAENGEYPAGAELERIVEDISYNNAKRFLGF
ncbi:MAG: glucuronate isomerase [Clostridia bacterium]|nr:glucuronate isomerase [Clostridia bacterium]